MTNRVVQHSLRLTPHVAVTFHRTLRIPDDGGLYPLPPGLGAFPLRRVSDYGRRVPAAWRKRGGYFIPLYQREALWISFNASWWRPSAVQIGVGGVNALTGRRLRPALRRRPQNYVVVPNQPWLDGINSGRGEIRQFVAMPLGSGYTVEGQLTGRETEGGLQIAVFDPRPGHFPEREPRGRARGGSDGLMCCESAPAMGLAAGGRMKQAIYPDPFGTEVWDPVRVATAHVHIVNSVDYEAITGEAAPPTPISARTYTEFGLPWFDLYDEHKGDLPPSRRLGGVQSVGELDAGRGKPEPADESPLSVPPWQVVTL